MKLLLLLLTLAFSVFAQSSEMSIQEYNSIQTSNVRSTVQFQKKQEMHRIHKVDEKALGELVQKETSQSIINQNLTHRGQILYYEVQTNSYILEVNAMDGSILKKVRKDD